MSIDLSRVTGISDSRGVITEIKDSLGRVIWAVSGGKAVLMVEKITSDTYAGETTYTGEQFILLDIYPKTNGTVKVTYGGLTKTVTDTSGAEEPNAQQVFFGTFKGVSDSVATPTSGELIIDGQYNNFACGSYQTGSKAYNTGYCSCITALRDWGAVEDIADHAFRGCSKLDLSELPSGITSIGTSAFMNCTNLTLSGTLPSGITSIGMSAFMGCTNVSFSGTLPSGLQSITSNVFDGCTNVSFSGALPSGITSLGPSAFNGCTNVSFSGALPSGITSIGTSAFNGCTNVSFSGTLPSGITSIGMSAFNGCTNVSFSGTLPDAITTVGESAFSGCTNVTIGGDMPPSLTEIGESAFTSSGVTFVTIPNVVTISSSAFANCASMTEVIIGDGVETVGDEAFNNCSLKNIIIRPSLKNLGSRSFDINPKGLTVTFLSPTPPEKTGSFPFPNDDATLKIVLPKGSTDAYSAAWNTTLLRYLREHSVEAT